jgi:serine/threonine-protein kinase
MAAGPTSNSMPQKGNAEYRKIQELASGGMGSVELSRAVGGPHAGEVVAVKRLHPHLEREKHFADMFFDEAWITAGLHHPNVVEIFDWGTDSVGRYLALEFVPGDSLLALIRETKKADRLIPLDLALYMIGKTAEGLHAAHELRNEQGQLRHLVHRDVTPSNVLIGLHGEVKLIDFGVAKARDKLSHTSTGTIKGKFGYMSPEQARGFPIDRRSDVFSLGVVLWETLGLKRLYRSESELEILRMIVEDPPVPISTVRDDVPPEVENLLAGALAKNRDDRLGSCGEFADFIWAIYHEHGYTAGERELAEFFRKSMPERCAAIEQLLSGAQDFIEPTLARPASGSFSGVGPHPVSGAIPLPRANHPGMPASAPSYAQEPFAAASITDGSLPAASYPAPTTQASPGSKSRVPLIIGLVVIGAGSLAGGAWAVTHGSRSNAAAAAPAVATQPAAPQPPVAPPPVAPPTAPTNPAIVASPTPEPVAEPGAHVTANSHSGAGHHVTPARTTQGSLSIIPLAPSNPAPSNTTGTASAPSNQNTASATHDEPRTSPSVRNDPPRSDPPRQSGNTASNGSGSGSSARSGSGSGSSTGTTAPANPTTTANPTAPRTARDLFGRDWGSGN